MKALLSQKLSYSAALLAMHMALLGYCGLYLIFSEKKREMGRMTGLVVNVVLSVIFLIAISTVAYIAHRNGYSNIVAIFALLMALAILGVRLVRISDTNKKPALAMLLMLGWMVGMLYVTMISRIGEESGPDININPFLAFEGVIESSYLIRHALLNVALFMPLGVILRAMEKEGKLYFRWLFIGAVISSGVEMIQLIWGLGQCDIIDILANSAGVLIGAICMHVFLWLWHLVFGPAKEKASGSSGE